jgi:hypothetical protein
MLNFNRRRLREKVRADRRGAASCWLSAHLASHPRPPAAGCRRNFKADRRQCHSNLTPFICPSIPSERLHE